MMAVRERIISVAAGTGVVALKEWSSGYFSANIFCMDFLKKLDWIDSEKSILIIYIMNRDRNMLKPDCEVVFFCNVNFRLTVLVDGSWIIRYSEAKDSQPKIDITNVCIKTA